MSKKISLPISYSVNQVYESKDTRFLNVTIDVMHTGENLNDSFFDKEVVEQELDSIKNTPILGYVNSKDTKDFEGHEYDIEKNDDGEYELVYAGHAYGVIPESCNPRWITKVASDGVSREYLQVDALMWTKFNDALDIMERDKIKAQSMEITECEGNYQDDGLFHFSKFKFDGCCLLSTTDDNIQPAMVGANVAAVFSADSVVSEIKNKLAEYYSFSVTCEGKETAMEENKDLEQVTVETPVVEPEVETEVEEFEVVETTEPEASEGAEISEGVEPETVEMTVEEETEVAEPTEPEAEFEEDNDIDSNEASFSMSMNQLYDAVYNAVGWEYMVYDITDSEVILMDYETGKLYGVPYAVVSETDVTVDMECKVAKKVEYVTIGEAEEAVGLEFVANEFKELKKVSQEYEAIKPMYDNYVALEEQARKEADELAKKEVIESYSLTLGDVEDFTTLIENSADMSLEQLKVECSNLFVNRKKAEAAVQGKSVVGNIFESEVELKYSAVRERYGIDLIK